MTFIEVPAHRRRDGRRTVFSTIPSTPASSVGRIPRIARMLALAHALRAALDGGSANGLSELAAGTGFTPERVTQLLDLTFLAPDIQERLVFGDVPLTAKALQPITLIPLWEQQRAALQRVLIRRKPRQAQPSTSHDRRAVAD
jgi:hypothetical protein